MEIENLNERMRLSKSQSKDAIAKKSRHLTPEFKEKRNKDQYGKNFMKQNMDKLRSKSADVLDRKNAVSKDEENKR